MLLTSLGELDVQGVELGVLPKLLMVYVALTGRSKRSELADVFFQHFPERSKRLKGLSDCLHAIVKADDSLIERSSTHVQVLLKTDVEQFIHSVETRCHDEAVKLYGGSFLNGIERHGRLTLSVEFDEWLINKRIQLQMLLQQALFALAKQSAFQERFLEAASFAQRIFDLPRDVTFPSPDDYKTLHSLFLAAEQFSYADLVKEEASEIYDSLALFEHAFEAKQQLTLTKSLPVKKSAFAGRQSELKALTRFILEDERRLVTVWAAGGMGKTELVAQFAWTIRNHFSEGAYFVSYADLEKISTEQFLLTIAAAMELSFLEQDVLAFLQETIADKQVLLILDNFESVLNHAATLSSLLKACSKLHILVTSREPLNLSHEYLFRLEPLSLLKDEGAQVLLFELAKQRGVSLATEAPEDVQGLLMLTGGLPLAMVLLSAWLGSMPLKAITEVLTAGLANLERLESDLPERHQNLNACFSLSLKQLTASQVASFFALSIFQSSFTLEAAVEVSSASLKELLRFVDVSLLSFNSVSQRYQFHPLIRQFANEHLSEGELSSLRNKHASYFLNLLLIRVSKEEKVKAKAIDILLPNKLELFSAWSWASDNHWDASLFDSSLAFFFFVLDVEALMDGKELFERTLGVTKQSKLSARIASCLAWLYLRLNSFELVIKNAKLALALVDKTNDDISFANAVLAYLTTANRVGDFVAAKKQALELLNFTSPDSPTYGELLGNLAVEEMQLGEYQDSLNHLEEAISKIGKDKTSASLDWFLLLQGQVFFELQHYEVAQLKFDQALILANEKKHLHEINLINLNKAKVYIAQKDYPEASSLISTLLTNLESNANQSHHVRIHRLAGQLALAMEHYKASEDYLKKSLSLAQKTKDVPETLETLVLIFDLCIKQNDPLTPLLNSFLTHEETVKKMSYYDQQQLKNLLKAYELSFAKPSASQVRLTLDDIIYMILKKA